MAITQADIDALDRAFATGVTRLTVGDKTVEYRSYAEYRLLRAQFLGEIASAGGTTPVRRILPGISKGLCT